MKTVFALANVVIKELYRRKDFYVLLFLTVVMTLGMWSIHFFNLTNVVGYTKEIGLLLIWISMLVIAITIAARQIPAECENRTIFPLLAKPVTRGQVVAGKFLGCWFSSGIALVVFYVFLLVVSASREGRWPVLLYLQACWLQWSMLAVVIALVLLGSVLFSAPSANVTISFVLVAGLLLVGGHLNQVALQQGGAVRGITYSIYFLIPHLEWFDVRNFIIHDWPPVPWWPCLLATLYAGVYAALLLFAAWLVFRRKALTA